MRYWLVVIGILLVGVGVWLVANNKRPNQKAVTSHESLVTSQQEERRKSKIAIMADVHNDTVTLRKALKQAKDEGVAEVIVDGDLTLDGKQEELVAIKKVLDEGGVKYVVVPGNHDWWGPKGTYAAVFGAEYQVLRVDGVKYILINDGDGKGLGEKQWRWLESEVGECRVVVCVAVAHEPLNHNFSKHIMGEGSKTVTAEAAKLLDLLVKNNVGRLYSGHLHYASSYNLGGMATTIVGAISSSRNNQTPRWTLIEGEGERVVEVN